MCPNMDFPQSQRSNTIRRLRSDGTNGANRRGVSTSRASPSTGHQLAFSVKRPQQVVALKDVKGVSSISPLILGLGLVLRSAKTGLKETLIGF